MADIPRPPNPITTPAEQTLPDGYSERWTRSILQDLIDLNVPHLRRLHQLRKAGWNDPKLNTHFVKQRRTAYNADFTSENVWFKLMKRALSEMDDIVQFIPRHGPFTFLDLGCAPGGFSSYTLGRNPTAHGQGISLHPKDGGHDWLLEKFLRRRYELTLGSLILYDLLPTSGRLHPGFISVPLQIRMTKFDLAILDGHQLQTETEDQTLSLSFEERNRLLLSQIVVAMQSLKHGGTLVMKLSHPENLQTAQIICMFDRLSVRVDAVKPTVIHANRGTFYLIARGVGLGVDGAQRCTFLESLRQLWHNTTFGGEDKRGRLPLPEDLDFIITRGELVQRYARRLGEIASPVWCVQKEALVPWLQRKGIAVPGEDV